MKINYNYDEDEFLEAWWVDPNDLSEQAFAKKLIASGRATPGQLRYIKQKRYDEVEINYAQVPFRPLDVPIVKNKINFNEYIDDPISTRRIIHRSPIKQAVYELEDEDYSLELEEPYELEEENFEQIESEKIEEPIVLPLEYDNYYLAGGKVYDTKEECPLGMLVQSIPLLVGGFRKKKKHMRKGGRKRTKDKVYALQLGQRNPSDMTRFKPNVLDEWRYEFKLGSDSSGNLSAYASLRDPLRAVNGSGVYERADRFGKVYDEFKILTTCLTINFVTLNTQQGALTIAADYDSIGTGVYTPTDLRDNQYMRKFTAGNMISYVAREIPISEGTYLSGIATIHQSGWYDFNSPPAEGVIIITGESFPASGAVARCILTQRVLMRRRRTIEAARKERMKGGGGDEDSDIELQKVTVKKKRC